MTESISPNYFLFPHMTLSETDARNLYLFLPHLHLLEITQAAPIPDWGRDKFLFWQAATDEKFLSQVRSSLQGYREFAEVHGGGPGGALAHLSQAFQEHTETRLEIQETLRGKSPAEPDGYVKELFRAAVFLEMARELDEKELDLESSYHQLNVLEGEFRGILGIAPEEESDAAETGLVSQLIPDRPGLLYMLARRVESWFRLMSQEQVGMPVFVALDPEVIDQVLGMIREGAHRTGRDFSTVRFPLGACPRLGGLGQKQFRSLIEAPGTTDLLLTYWRDLEEFIEAAAQGESAGRLEERCAPLRDRLEKVCGIREVPDRGKIGLELIALPDLPLASVFEIFEAPQAPTPGNWPAMFLCTV